MKTLIVVTDIVLDVVAAVLYVLRIHVHIARLRAEVAGLRSIPVDRPAPYIIGDESPFERWANGEGSGPLTSLERGDDGMA